MPRLTIKEKVANGARFLDENFPGWETRINIETLHLEDGQRCICGQLFAKEGKRSRKYGVANGFDYAAEYLFAQANGWISALLPKNATEERKYQVSDVLGFSTNREYVGLQREWTRLLRERASVAA